MKRYILNTTILFSIFLSLTSCEHIDSDKPRVVKLNSFIATYLIIDNVKLVKAENNKTIYISPTFRAPIIEFNSKYAHVQRLYDSLRTRHNDVMYNKTASAIPGPRFPSVTTPNISEIKITCNVDFDATHPTGSSLNDIVRFMGYSYYPFIVSGYTSTYDLTSFTLPDIFKEIMINTNWSFSGKSFYHYDEFNNTINKPLIPVCKMVSELSISDLLLLYYNEQSYYRTNDSFSHLSYLGALYFEQTPDTPGNYEITVEMVGDNGKTYKTTTIITFE